MTKTVASISLLILLAACRSRDAAITPAAAPARRAAAPVADRTLYARLGGYDAIAAVTDDFLGRMIADRQLGRYFVGLGQSSRDILREHVIEFLCYEAKGPCLYVGRDLGEVHTGLHITESDWQVALKHLDASLDRFKVPAREHAELVAAIGSFKEDIVGK